MGCCQFQKFYFYTYKYVYRKKGAYTNEVCGGLIIFKKNKAIYSYIALTKK